MTAPDTNLERQKRRHKAPLTAFVLIGVVAAAALAVFASLETSPDAAPALEQSASTPQS